MCHYLLYFEKYIYFTANSVPVLIIRWLFQSEITVKKFGDYKKYLPRPFKYYRAEQEKKLAQQKKEEEERLRKEEADKKAKEAEEKRKRLEEAEKKRQAMMQAQKEKQQAAGGGAKGPKKTESGVSVYLYF